jgi:hypothetical protein
MPAAESARLRVVSACHLATRRLSGGACHAGDWLRESEGVRAKLEAAEAELEAARTGRAQADEKIAKLQQCMQVTRALLAGRVRRWDLTRLGGLV